jgi:UvrD-like helicase family protein
VSFLDRLPSQVPAQEPTPPSTSPAHAHVVTVGYRPTPQQLAFLSALTNTTRNITLQARAGSGKTSSILLGVDAYLSRYPSHELLICAYNKSIQLEIDAKLKARAYDWRQVGCQTVHGMGMGLLKFVYRPRVEEKKVYNLLRKRQDIEPRTSPFWAYPSQILSLVSLGKQAGVGFFDDLAIEEGQVWRDLADHYDVEFDGVDGMNMNAIIRCVQEIYTLSLSITDEIDFDDMILFPLIKNLRVKFTKDLILGDEFQDWSRARQALVKKFMRPHAGRLVAVGDSRQAIYGFCHPTGTNVLTPVGYKTIETLKPGDSVIVSNLNGETEGWSGTKTVQKVHRYKHEAILKVLTARDRTVKLTVNHKIPVRISEHPYFTYLMRRCGIYRVGYCQAWTSGQFMLQLRKKTEKADAVWILEGHETKSQAKKAEASLLTRVKGTTFHLLSDAEVLALPSDEVQAHSLLIKFGRYLEFPLLGGSAVRISRRGAFVTEACNVISRMKVAFFQDMKRGSEDRRGRNRQRFDWTWVEAGEEMYQGEVVGLTITPASSRNFPGGYSYPGLPLYFAGEGESAILVHNSGADAQAMTNFTRELDATVLPLSVTFRCPKAVVALAQRIVPDIEAAESAPEGEVIRQAELITRQEWRAKNGQCDMGEALLQHGTTAAWNVSYPDGLIFLGDLTPGLDCILCRNNAPLVPLAYSLIRGSIPAKVEGRKIGEGLQSLCTRWQCRGTADLLNRLEDFRARETQKYLAKSQEAKAQEVEDRVDTLREIIAEVNRRGHRDIASVLKFIDDLFADGGKACVTLSSYHRSKGREWERVFLFEHTSRCPSKAARQQWQKEQESNLAYVAYTRAKKTLVFVG